MSTRHRFPWPVMSLLAIFTGACASHTAPHNNRPSMFAAAANASRPTDIGARRAGTQPLRLRQPQNLREGRFAAQFRFEDTPRGSALQASAAYGVDDQLMLQARIGTGHQFETVSQADDPGRLFDVAAQYALLDDDGWQLAGRFDLVLSDESSFELVENSARVSLQPGVLLNAPLSADVELYADTSLRLGDGVEPTLASGVGLVTRLGRLRAFVELDAIVQQVVGGKDIFEAYLTPGLQFVLRQRVDISLSPSIGLSTTAEDWRLALTMGVHF